MRTMRSKKLFYFEDMIGKKIYAKRREEKNVEQAKFKGFGCVIDETANTLICSSDKFGTEPKVLIKNNYIFRFHEKDGNGTTTIFEIDGDLLKGLPDHRIKSIRKKRLKLW